MSVMTLECAIAEATARGSRAGKSAASWCFDGNTTDATYRDVARMLEDGDPMLDSRIAAPDWLSGEFAGESIPELLGDLLPEDEDEDDGEQSNEIYDAYCNAADEAFWAEVERTVNFQLGE